MSEISEDDLQKRIEVLEKQLESIKYRILGVEGVVVIMICFQLLSMIASTSDQPLRSVYQFSDYIIHWFTN